MHCYDHQPLNLTILNLDTQKTGPRNRRALRPRGARAACLILGALLASGPLAASLPAFPGAEGGGALAVGGRGGAVCKVTNLNDSGTGSLRHCIDLEVPRTVIFTVGGTIKLRSSLVIRNPYITIAGQTAPGGGIQIKADKQLYEGGDLLRIWADEVIVRYLRLRKGYTDQKDGNIRVTGSSVIVDHVSMFWAENQNWTVYTWGSTGPSNVTLQNSIVTEMLDGRVNILAGASNSSGAASMHNIDHHNNFIANSKHRNPSAQFASGRWVNNIFYHWESWAARSIGGVKHDWISNFWKPGPSRPGSRGQHELQFIQSHRGDAVHVNLHRIKHGHPLIYISGNRGLQSGMSPDSDNWSFTREAGKSDDPTVLHNNGGVFGSTPVEWRRHERLPDTPIPITVRQVDEVQDYLLPIVGASKRLDCAGNWVPNRDTADRRAVDEYLNNEGTLSSAGEGEEIYGGHPSLAAGLPCVDSSGDGVPDEWVVAQGFDPTDPKIGATVHDTGYTYLELYLNGMQIGLAAPSRVQITVE